MFRGVRGGGNAKISMVFGGLRPGFHSKRWVTFYEFTRRRNPEVQSPRSS